jgi:hypothetical protein
MALQRPAWTELRPAHSKARKFRTRGDALGVYAGDMKSCAVAALCLAAGWPPSPLAQTAHPAAPPCQASEYRQFDFWLGSWSVFTPDGKKAGDNRIEAIDGGCALIERWRGGGGFSGTSLNSWHAATRQWHQHWVDNQGGLLRLAGGRDGERMVLRGSSANDGKPGATRRQRISWTPLPDGAVRQLWEQSDDDGATWRTVFDGRYVRVGPP